MKKTVAFSRESTNIFFHILTRCNLACRHCYINRDQHGRDDLSIDTINSWLAFFSEKSRQANVIFLGGEPTLHPELAEAVKSARKLGYKSITIDTNGYLFHDILDRISPDDVDYVSFSLDGASKEVNDSIRGSGCYERCVSGIQRAVSKGFKTSLIYTVSSANIHELAMMPNLLKQFGIDRFFIQVIGLRGNVAETGTESDAFPDNHSIEDHFDGDGNPQISRERWLAEIPAVAERVADLGITVTYPKVFLDSEEVFECAGKVADNYFIFPNGRVYRCPLCEDYPVHGMAFENDHLVSTGKINESDLFNLDIPEGCVMNKLIQPGNLSYDKDGAPEYKVACCLLKEEIAGR